MTIREQLIEAMAREIHETMSRQAVIEYLDNPFDASVIAAAALTAIEAAGLCIVPREPNNAILSAGVTQSVSYPVCPPGMTIAPVHQFTLTCCYRAMIDAGRL